MCLHPWNSLISFGSRWLYNHLLGTFHELLGHWGRYKFNLASGRVVPLIFILWAGSSHFIILRGLLGFKMLHGRWRQSIWSLELASFEQEEQKFVSSGTKFYYDRSHQSSVAEEASIRTVALLNLVWAENWKGCRINQDSLGLGIYLFRRMDK